MSPEPCGCPEPTTCGCYFAGSDDVIATGVGTVDNPMRLVMPDGRRPTITCTSDNRPPPIDGQFIFERDTQNTRVWNGFRWQMVKAHRDISVQPFSGVAATGHIGPGTTINVVGGTVISPWESTDPYVVDAVGVLSFYTGSGAGILDTWELQLAVGDLTVIVDKDRRSAVDNYICMKVASLGYRAVAGTPMQMNLKYLGGSGDYTLFDDESAEAIFRLTASCRCD